MEQHYEDDDVCPDCIKIKADNSANVTVNITVNRFAIEWRALKWVMAYIKDRKKMPSTMVGVFTGIF